MWKPTVLAVVVMIGISTRSARAQPDERPRIPQPNSVTELARYGEILGVSVAQQVAIEAEYDAYLDDLDPLRVEMIEAAVAAPDERWDNDPLAALLPGFVSRVHAMDDGFFDRIGPMLIENQQGRLPRVRALRERMMLCGVQALNRFVGDGLPEMRELLESLGPPPEALIALTPALEEYEQRSTPAVRAAFDAATRLCAADRNDQAIDNVVNEVKRLRAINRKLIEDLGPALPEDVRGAWWTEFLARAYGHSNLVTDVFTIARIDAALASEITEAERVSLEALRTSAAAYESQARTKMLDLHDQYAISRAPPQGAIADSEYYEGVNAMQREVMAKDDEFRKTLDGLLGTERVKALKPAHGRFVPSMGGIRAACGVRANVCRVYDAAKRPGVPESRSDALIPAPLSADEVEVINISLNLRPEDAQRLRERFRSLANAMAKKIEPMQDGLFGTSMSKRVPSEAADDPMKWAQACDQAREEVRAAIKAADADLLEQLRAALPEPPDDAMWRRVTRMHERAQVTLDLALSTGANHSGEVDVLRMLLMCGLDAETWVAVESVTTRYEAQLSADLKSLFDAYRDNAIKELARRAGLRESDVRTWSRRIDDLHRQHQAIAKLNSDTVDQLVATLPEEKAIALRDAFDRAAFPLAFDDRAGMEAALARAASLNDLRNDQRERVREIRSAYAAAVAENRQRLVIVCAALRPDLPAIGFTGTPERMANQERFSLESGRLLDERAQINRRAMRGLHMTLSPAQLQLVTAATAEPATQ